MSKNKIGRRIEIQSPEGQIDGHNWVSRERARKLIGAILTRPKPVNYLLLSAKRQGEGQILSFTPKNRFSRKPEN